MGDVLLCYMVRMPITVLKVIQNSIYTAANVRFQDKWVERLYEYLATTPGHIHYDDLFGLCRTVLKLPVKDLHDYDVRLLFETLLDEYPEHTDARTLTFS